MASFNAHLTFALCGSGLASTALLVGGLASEREVLLYFALGSIGGLLPDIDSDSSNPVRIAFLFISLLAAFMAMFAFGASYSILELCVIWLATFLLVRWCIFWVFTRITVHRGVLHSIPAGLTFGFATTAAAYHLFDAPALTAWLSGAFVCCGYMLHLILDELYSVDLFGITVKRSLGTALKLFSWKYPIATVLLYGAMGLAFYLTPAFGPVAQTIAENRAYETMLDKLLPEQRWFHGLELTWPGKAHTEPRELALEPTHPTAPDEPIELP